MDVLNLLLGYQSVSVPFESGESFARKAYGLLETSHFSQVSSVTMFLNLIFKSTECNRLQFNSSFTQNDHLLVFETFFLEVVRFQSTESLCIDGQGSAQNYFVARLTSSLSFREPRSKILVQESLVVLESELMHGHFLLPHDP